MKYVAWFSEIKKEDVGSVGGKGANLGEMYNIGLPIPPGFCVTAKGYDFFLQKTGIKNKIKEILSGIDINDTDELEKRAEEIQELIINAKMPDELGKEIEEAYNHLDVNIDLFKVVNKSTLSMIKAGRSLPYVAVRSSATAEDLPEASFAGQQETYLNVKGSKNVTASVIKCFASLFKARAIYYREKNHFDHLKVKLSAVVQKMINSEKSGVIFSANPSTNNRDEIVIEAGFGLGEAIVLGEINPDNYTVDKNSFEIKNIIVKEKTFMITRDENLGRTIKRKLPQNKWKEQVLKNDEIINLAKYGAKIDEHYGKPMDMEFAIDKGKIFIVQARPITTLKEAYHKNQETMGRAGYGQRPESEEDVILRGLPASRGIASGKVKIVESMHDLSKVLKGDVLVAKMTNPDYVMAMQRASAIVTDEGGSTSHAAIVSREMGIPCVVGTEKATQVLREGMEITVDGGRGLVWEGIRAEIPHNDVHVAREEGSADYDTITKVKVICDLPDRADVASQTNADGVGLVRIEFIIAENGIHPIWYMREGRDDEYTNVLYNGLNKIADAFKGKPVWIRTSDIRSDEYRNLRGGDMIEDESNPMIGWHGIRFALDETKILEAEFRAVKRLHDNGYSNILIEGK